MGSDVGSNVGCNVGSNVGSNGGNSGSEVSSGSRTRVGAALTVGGYVGDDDRVGTDVSVGITEGRADALGLADWEGENEGRGDAVGGAMQYDASSPRNSAWSFPDDTSPFDDDSPNAEHATNVGTLRSTKFPRPSCPLPLAPVPYTSPLAETKKAFDAVGPECTPAMSGASGPAAGPRPRTCTGESELSNVPSPSCPRELSPQARTEPLSRSR